MKRKNSRGHQNLARDALQTHSQPDSAAKAAERGTISGCGSVEREKHPFWRAGFAAGLPKEVLFSHLSWGEKGGLPNYVRSSLIFIRDGEGFKNALLLSIKKD